MAFHVVFKLLLFLERHSAQLAWIRLVSGVRPTDVAVVGGVGGEGLPAVLALEGPLTGVLSDVCAQNAGGSEGLGEWSLKHWVNKRNFSCQVKGKINVVYFFYKLTVTFFTGVKKYFSEKVLIFDFFLMLLNIS